MTRLWQNLSNTASVLVAFAHRPKVQTCLWVLLLLFLATVPIYIYSHYPALVGNSAFGLWTKILAALGGAGFGILGVGKETRVTGKLTRTGWIALLGIVVAGELALTSTFSDAISGQKKDRLLLMSVQRGVYRFHGLTLWMDLPLDKNFYGLETYKRTLRRAFPVSADKARRGTPAHPVELTEAIGLHPVPAGSRLFPAPGSPLYTLINNLTLDLLLFAYNENPSPPETSKYTFRGRTVISWQDQLSDHAILIYNNQKDTLSLQISKLKVPDDVAKEASAFSLVDFMPGTIAVGLSMQDITYPMCKSLHLSKWPDCIDQQNAFNGTLVPSLVFFSFDDPISIEITAKDSVHCLSKDGHYVVLPFPKPFESTYRFRAADYSKSIVKADVAAVCTALNGNATSYVSSPE
jgi:hypothetical protein